MSGFTNLSILECNRLSSEEAKTGNDNNPALFTNKLGTGVPIDVGDTIQVSSCFISEQGAGDEDTIEFKGKNLNSSRTIEFLTPTKLEPVSIADSNEEFAKITWSASTPSVSLFDNKASIVIEYFKNANGENYYQLPRKYCAYIGPGSHGGSVSASGTHNLWFAQEDSLASGNASYSKGGLPFHQIPYFSTTSSKLYYVVDDYNYVSGALHDSIANNQASAQYYKIRNDNSRYTIYVAEENYYVPALDESGDPSGFTNTAPASYWVQELSQRKYLRYSERIDLEVNTGFNSARNVADSLTSQLTKTGEVKTIEYPPFSDEEPYFSPSRKLTTFLESPTYKTFSTANVSTTTDVMYSRFNASHDPTDASQTPDASTINYINQTNYIGIKRPDLYDAGYLVNTGLKDTNGNLFTPAPIFSVDTLSTSNLIQTTIAFTADNITLLKNLFDEQGNHPELFTNKYNEYANAFSGEGTTTDNSRFIHINSRRYKKNTTDNLLQLGTDDVSNASSYFDSSADNYITLPLFFYFDKSRKDIADGGDLNDPTKLYNGFAMRNGTGHICFWVGGSHGTTYAPIPPDYFTYNNNSGSGVTNKIFEGTYLGWDTHFTAYSMCAIALTNGWLNETWNGGDKTQTYWNVGINTTWDTTGAVPPNASSSREVSPVNALDYVSRIYLGSQKPLIDFNASSNRFTISQLHTSEYEGQLANVGGAQTSGSLVSQELNPQADREVYKINKRSNCFSWTTACIPFNAVDVVTASGTESFTLELPNVNLELYTIFDSQSGIVIKDFGFNEDDWNDGLWGIMGFTYNQFNTAVSSNNDITERITERNANALPYAFTNADVSASDTIDFITNGWGAPMYNSMLPTSYIWNGSGQTGNESVVGHRTGFKIENPPAITKAQTSISLVAENLPRRMLRPYYCIRSDILADSYYLGGADSGQSLPVVAIVNKIDGYGDFYFGTQSDFIFTATKSRMLTSITTSIHSPDQQFAKVDFDSAVIYKITKQMKSQSNIIEELIQEKGLSKEQIASLEGLS